MQRCPNCKARDDGGDNCRRCGMELGLLRRTERAAERLTRQAFRQLAIEQPAAAETTLLRVRSLQQQPLAEQLLGFIRAEEIKARTILAQRHRIIDSNPWD